MQAQHPQWPIVLTGDLNTQPRELPYQLLVSRGPYDPAIVRAFEDSRLVHTSVAKVGLSADESETPTPSGTGTATPAEGAQPTEADKDDEDEGDGEGEGELPDNNEKSIANTRAPTPADGIISLDEINTLAAELLPRPARSAYASTQWDGETYAARGGLDGLRGKGGHEPAYTCFTPLFRLTLGECRCSASRSRNLSLKLTRRLPL